jgi:beta-lactamase class D
MFTNNKGISEKDHVKKINDSIIDPQLQKLLDSSKLSGSILIFDVEKGKYFCSNDFALTKKVFLPASTFKVPNTLIGLETGIININTIFKWDGKKRKLKIWEKDLNLHDAFHASCVPCFQELAEKIGPKRMQEYLNKFEYGNSNISLIT